VSSAVIVLFPAPGGPVMPIRLACPCFECRLPSISSMPGRWFSTMLTARASAAVLPRWKSPSSLSVATGKYSLLPLPHGGPGAAFVVGMIVPSNMQRSVNDKTRKLFTYSNAISLCVHPRDVGADVDVADSGHSGGSSPHPERDDVG